MEVVASSTYSEYWLGCGVEKGFLLNLAVSLLFVITHSGVHLAPYCPQKMFSTFYLLLSASVF